MIPYFPISRASRTIPGMMVATTNTYTCSFSTTYVKISACGASDAHPRRSKGRSEYRPFGRTLVSLGNQTISNHFRFSTKYWDDETGLGYWGYRHLSAEMGRWVSRDPINEPGHTIRVTRNLETRSSLVLSGLIPDQSVPVSDAAGRLGMTWPLTMGNTVFFDLPVDLDPLTGGLSPHRGGNVLNDAPVYVFVFNSTVSSVDPLGLEKEKRYGLPDQFWRWYHRNRKRSGDPNLTRQWAIRYWEEWVELGKPGADKKDRRGCR